jgi:NAD(P)-dependent dehydrogenase (short-subunit alcohol dehydrogenase family)
MAMNGVPLSRVRLTPRTPFDGAGLRVAVIGGTGGIGRAISEFLATNGAQVTVIGRTFRDAGVPNITFVEAHLETMDAAQRLADALPAEDLDALIFTNGIITAPTRELTAEGIERDMAVSYLSRFGVLRAVGERLGANRPRRARVFLMGFPGTDEKGRPDDLNADVEYKQFPQHLNTVAANEALVLDAAQRFPKLSVFGINPGLIKTDIRANVLGGNQSVRFKVFETVLGWFTPTADAFAANLVPVLFAPELERESGFHFNKHAAPIQPSTVMTPDHVAAFTEASEALWARATRR